MSVRYLQSDDVKEMAQETVSNVMMETVVDFGYVETGDEISLQKAFERVLKQQEVTSERLHISAFYIVVLGLFKAFLSRFFEKKY